nr:MAG TPA: hypothetical protein [Caudoviricetes sp.]
MIFFHKIPVLMIKNINAVRKKCSNVLRVVTTSRT